MKICLILEGSYPYITGGVSSWTQSLITHLKEHEFILYTIGAEKKNKGLFKYQLPENVIHVEEIFLDDYTDLKGVYGKKFNLNEDIKKCIKSLIIGERVDMNILFDFFKYKKRQYVINFFMSRVVFDIIKDAYTEKHPLIPFNDFFWTVRSMLLPLFFIINNKVPEADLYHSASTGYGGIVGSLAKHIYNQPFILTEHGIYTREREEEIIKSDWIKGYYKDMWVKFFYNLSNCAYKRADKVVALFSKNKAMQVELGCPKEVTQIIPNGVDVAEFEDIKLKDPDDEHINIGALLRVVPIKDIKTMIMSFSLVKKKVKHAKLYLMGPTHENETYYKECVNLVKNLELQDVIFTGRINAKDYLGKMDILILSSISEGQPLVILEGFSCKKPFISTDVGSCKELIDGNDNYGQAGFVVPVMNSEKMADAIIKLCHNERLRIEMGLNGYKRVSALYTSSNFINAYKEIYREHRK